MRSPEHFVARRGSGVDAVVVRIGLNGAQLVLVDTEGRWDRWVYRSEDEARQIAERLGIRAHVGEYPDEVRVRMNAHRRPADDFDLQAYPEMGHIGPLTSYPENRRRPP